MRRKTNGQFKEEGDKFVRIETYCSITVTDDIFFENGRNEGESKE